MIKYSYQMRPTSDTHSYLYRIEVTKKEMMIVLGQLLRYKLSSSFFVIEEKSRYILYF